MTEKTRSKLIWKGITGLLLIANNFAVHGKIARADEIVERKVSTSPQIAPESKPTPAPSLSEIPLQSSTPNQKPSGAAGATQAARPSGESGALVKATATQSPSPAKEFFKRWIDLQTATLNLRYRFVDNSAGLITTNQVQHREALRFRLKLDKPGRYAFNFGLFTGTRFTSGWDNTGLGINPAQRNLAFKQLYFAAQPVTGVEFQIGGLYIVKGESTELTSYDEDGYITGERVSIRRPKQLFFDEISITSAYFVGGTGPENIPVSVRFPHFAEQNYHHVLLDKKIGKRAGLSSDYTMENGRRTWRQAVNLKLPETRIFDSITFEDYQRTNSVPAYGLAITAEKGLNKHISINGGYAQIDPKYGPLNADRFNIGKRVFFMATYTFSPQFTASFFITTAVGSNGVLPQRTLTNTIFTYNLMPALKRTGLF